MKSYTYIITMANDKTITVTVKAKNQTEAYNRAKEMAEERFIGQIVWSMSLVASG